MIAVGISVFAVVVALAAAWYARRESRFASKAASLAGIAVANAERTRRHAEEAIDRARRALWEGSE